ncbi:MAG: nitroreductase family protein [Anaerolineales bacterium]
MAPKPGIPLPDQRSIEPKEMIGRAREFAQEMSLRRTVRQFSDKPVPVEIIRSCLRAAGSSPSGANRQPWHFAVVQDPKTKRRIRKAAEEEERAFYQDRAPGEWLEALEPLGTNRRKPFLETAPYLIAIFVQPYGLDPDGQRIKHYYAVESVGIASGLLITGLHHAGLATLTHTPSPMGFLNAILDRPQNERPFLLLVTGFPAPNATVPDLEKKSFDEIVSFH